MRLHISVGQPELAGFVNIDVSKQNIDLGKLDNFCEASECTKIVINDVLKFMPYDKMPFIIQHLASRLRHRGTITFIFTDINSIIREYNGATIDEKTLNRLLYDQGARCSFSIDYIERILSAVRLTVTEASISKEQVIITAERP